jgi:hypothetical protein
MNNEAATNLLVSSGVSLAALHYAEHRVAHICGTQAFEFSAEEQAGLRRFLTDGGTLVADAVGGAGDFVESLEKYVGAALNVTPAGLPRDAAIYRGDAIPGAATLSGVQYRRSTRSTGGRDIPQLRGYDVGRRYAVIYSPLDLSAGLLGTPIYGCNGYAPDACLRIMRNVLLYANLTTAEKAALSGKP